jgi:peroxiredoxin
MGAVRLFQPAPIFALKDFNGREVTISDYQGKKSIILIFNRGFF